MTLEYRDGELLLTHAHACTAPYCLHSTLMPSGHGGVATGIGVGCLLVGVEVGFAVAVFVAVAVGGIGVSVAVEVGLVVAVTGLVVAVAALVITTVPAVTSPKFVAFGVDPPGRSTATSARHTHDRITPSPVNPCLCVAFRFAAIPYPQTKMPRSP